MHKAATIKKRTTAIGNQHCFSRTSAPRYLYFQGCLKKAGGAQETGQNSALGIQDAVRVLESLRVHATNKCTENVSGQLAHTAGVEKMR